MRTTFFPQLRRFLGILALLIATQSLARAAELREQDIKVTSSPTTDRVDIQLSDNVTIRVVDGIETTDYFFIDIYQSTAAFSDKKFPIKDGILKAIEAVSYPDLRVVRLIFYPANKTIFQVADATTAFVYPAATAASREFSSNRRSTRHLIIDTSKYRHYPLPAVTPVAPPPAASGPVAPAAVAAAKTSSRKRVIIDAGHGGHDPGTQSITRFNGKIVDEKDVALAIAFEMERLMRKLPNVTPILTRDHDVYMSKTDRVDFAEKLEGDIFVCIHANATKYHVNDPSLRGVELYYLGANSNPDLKDLEAAENLEVGAPLDRSASTQWLAIAKQVTKDNLDIWRSFAAEACEDINTSFGADPYYGQFKNRVREARFRVLYNRVMPSLLIEVGYMDIPDEMRRLVDPAFQKRIALLITNGVLRYFAEQDPKFAYFQYGTK